MTSLERSDRVFAAGLLVSLAVHAGLAIGFGKWSDVLTRGLAPSTRASSAPDRPVRDTPPPEPTPPRDEKPRTPPPLPEILLGREESTARSMTWLGFTEATEHHAPQGVEDQSAMSIAAAGRGNRPEPGADEPASPSPTPTQAAPPASSRAAVPPAPEPAPAESPSVDAPAPAPTPEASRPAPSEAKHTQPSEMPLAEPAPPRADPSPLPPDAARPPEPSPAQPQPIEPPTEPPPEPLPEVPTAQQRKDASRIAREALERVRDLADAAREALAEIRPVRPDAGAPELLEPRPDPTRLPDPPPSTTRPPSASNATPAAPPASRNDPVAARPIEQERPPEKAPGKSAPPSQATPSTRRPAPPSSAQPQGGNGIPGLASDKESIAAAVRAAPVVRPGQVLASKGLDIRTVQARWSLTTLRTQRPRNPTIAVTFRKNGTVKWADFVSDRDFVYDAGSLEINQPLLTAVFSWTAKGEVLRNLPDDPDAGLTLIFTIMLVP